MNSIILWIVASLLYSAISLQAQESELDKILQGNIPVSVRYIFPDSISWTPSAPDQIKSFSKLKPLLPHTGFHPFSEKKALVWTNALSERGIFEIKDLANGNTIYQDSLRSWGFHPWGGYNLVADFSTLQQPGRYQMYIRLRNSGLESFSEAFSIRFSVYRELTASAFRWFASQQCHKNTCVLHVSEDKTGGWHDDGFLNKNPSESFLPLFVLSRYFTLIKADFPALADSVRALLTGQVASLYTSSKPSSPPLLTSISDKADHLLDSETLALHAQILATAAQLKITRIQLPALPTIKTACSQLDKHITKQPFNDFSYNNYITCQSSLLLYAIARYQESGHKKYLRMAEAKVRDVLTAQDTSGHFFSTPDHFWLSSDPSQAFIALYAYYSLQDKLMHRQQTAQAFRRYALQLVRTSFLSPFGHASSIQHDKIGLLINSRTAGFNAWLLAFTYQLYKEDIFLTTAIHTFNWLLGFNPADRSLMAGTGNDPGAYHHLAPAKDGYPSGLRPGGILNGFTSGLPGLTPLNEEVPPFEYVIGHKLPAIYPLIDTDTGKTSASLTNGYHATNNAWFIMAAMLLEKLTDEVPVLE